MEEIIAYKASNGRLFDSKEKCISYEKKLSQYPKVKETDIPCRANVLFDKSDKPIDVIKHVIERWEKPSSQKKVEVYYIVGSKYKFTDLFGRHDFSLMNLIFNMTNNEITHWRHAANYFAEKILEGNELTDDYMLTEIEAINSENLSRDKYSTTLVLEIEKPNKKWKIDNSIFHSGSIAPHTFTIEKIS